MLMKYIFIIIALMLVVPPTLGALATNDEVKEQFKGKKTPIIILASATPASAFAWNTTTGHIDLFIDLQNNKDGVSAYITENGVYVAQAISQDGLIVFNSPNFEVGQHVVTVVVENKPTPICGEGISISCAGGVLTFTI